MEVQTNHNVVVVDLLSKQLRLSICCIETRWLTALIERNCWASNDGTGLEGLPFERIAVDWQEPACTYSVCACRYIQLT